jgi:hypothetical protein
MRVGFARRELDMSKSRKALTKIKEKQAAKKAARKAGSRR